MQEQKQHRQRWMSIMAKADPKRLTALSDDLLGDMHFHTLRGPETGLIQVRARAGGVGNAFNVGDMTLTRCVVRSEPGSVGYSFVAGRDKLHALRAAQLDALLQLADYRDLLMERVIDPLEREQQAAIARARQAADKTRVDFFTLVRGEN